VLNRDGNYSRVAADGQISAQARLLSLHDDRVALTES
jgi:hypothetical protein